MALPLNRLKNDLHILLTITGLLSLIGLVFIYSSSSIYALEKFGSAHYFLVRQFLYLVPSLLGFLVFALIPIEFFKKWSPLLFFGALILTSLTLIPSLGVKMHGSNRWLLLGTFSFQPSELLKLFLFMYIGAILEKKQHKLTSLIHLYLPLLVVLGATFLILLKQPDFGSVVTIFVTSLALFFVAECKMIYLVVTGLCSLPVILFLIFTKAYRLNRILIFINPWSDPKGRGFQIIQSLIAIGSGQFWGVGISQSRQKFFYLPMQHTDFIFPIIAEETGFIGSLIIISLYLSFCFFGLRLALSLDRPFTFFTTLAFVVFISLQAVINIMVTAGLLPTKGLGLPFISYGGTALVCLWCMIGFMVNSARSVN